MLVEDFGGARSVPFMQVILVLLSDLDSGDHGDQAAVSHILAPFVRLMELDMVGHHCC